MAEAYSGDLRGVGLQLMARIKPLRPGQREDIKLNGNRLTLLDINNRVRDEAEVFEVFPPRTTNMEIFDTQLRPFIDSVLQGLNLGVFTIGSTDVGKSHTLEGSKADPGIIPSFVQGLFAAIDGKISQNNNDIDKKTQGMYYNCMVRMQFVEIVDEEITDLLGRSDSLAIANDEWEGPTVAGAERKVITNEQQFLEAYTLALQNKTNLVNEFGKLSDKAAAVLVVEIIQSTALGDDTQILVSKVTFVDLPGSEVLAQDPETLRIKQGSTLNQGILGVQSVLNDLASGRREYAMYESSKLTKLCKETFGGNTIGLALFNLRYDDQIGSSVTFKLIKLCQKIINFPIVNDNRSICLLRKYRVESNSLRQILSGTGNETMEKYQQKLDEMEKRMIDENLEALKFADDKKQVSSKVQDMRDKYNALVAEKIELQKLLLTSEEEKVAVSKALIELQIENAKLNEMVQSSNFEGQTKAVSEEAEGLELQLRLEKAQKVAQELQQELAKALEDKKELEIEFVALKKNFLNKTQELEEQKRKNEQVGIELVNLVNENKALAQNSTGIVKKQGTVYTEYERSMKRTTQLENEIARLKEETVRLNAEVQRSRAEKTKAEIAAERAKVEYENKQVELEKELIRLSNNKDLDTKVLDTTESSPLKKIEKEQWEKEKFAYQRRCRELNRKLEAATHDFEEAKLDVERLNSEKAGLISQVEELQQSYRQNMGKMLGDQAMEKLVESYKTQECNLKTDVEALNKRIGLLQTKCRTLREYSRELRAVAEDLLPENEPKPSILSKSEPGVLKEEKDFRSPKKMGGSNIEGEYLREENARLKAELQNLKGGSKKPVEENAIQRKILEELKALKGDHSTLTRPGTASAEVEALRKERNQLLEENRRLKQIIEQDAVGPTSGGSLKQFKQRIFYLENAIRDLEKERSELKVRATMAEQQLKTLQEHYNRATHEYQKKINELKRRDAN